MSASRRFEGKPVFIFQFQSRDWLTPEEDSITPLRNIGHHVTDTASHHQRLVSTWAKYYPSIGKLTTADATVHACFCPFSERSTLSTTNCCSLCVVKSRARSFIMVLLWSVALDDKCSGQYTSGTIPSSEKRKWNMLHQLQRWQRYVMHQPNQCE